MRGMNLEKLFETQKVLRERINYQGEDRFNKLVLALLVELGECANEWRGFKFWSKDQEPRTKVQLFPNSDGTAPDWNNKNPLLEEYVDCLHFILELGLEIHVDEETKFPYLHEHNFSIYTESEATSQFNNLFKAVNDFLTEKDLESYEEMFLYLIGLGDHLGFICGQVEQAYYDKNKVNHKRQENGY
jgi:dimeric dUTPase (all-alpha-NTP-PPase superfamily)